ncbi:hypothetical protein BC833DRAFT_640045 [Globomyces pollinis-pini]|nr:hypothetical protein BC833DRAFT_640045 [Globomyces pollinis-pini]
MFNTILKNKQRSIEIVNLTPVLLCVRLCFRTSVRTQKGPPITLCHVCLGKLAQTEYNNILVTLSGNVFMFRWCAKTCVFTRTYCNSSLKHQVFQTNVMFCIFYATPKRNKTKATDLLQSPVSLPRNALKDPTAYGAIEKPQHKASKQTARKSIGSKALPKALAKKAPRISNPATASLSGGRFPNMTITNVLAKYPYLNDPVKHMRCLVKTAKFDEKFILAGIISLVNIRCCSKGFM